MQSHMHLLFPDGHSVEPAEHVTSSADLRNEAARTTQRKWIFLNRENNRFLLIKCTFIPIAFNAKPMIQYARGYTSTSFCMSIFSFKVRLNPDET